MPTMSGWSRRLRVRVQCDQGQDPTASQHRRPAMRAGATTTTASTEERNGKAKTQDEVMQTSSKTALRAFSLESWSWREERSSDETCSSHTEHSSGLNSLAG
eukprot:2702709-Rhodomonas_salina.5